MECCQHHCRIHYRRLVVSFAAPVMRGGTSGSTAPGRGNNTGEGPVEGRTPVRPKCAVAQEHDPPGGGKAARGRRASASELGNWTFLVGCWIFKFSDATSKIEEPE